MNKLFKKQLEHFYNSLIDYNFKCETLPNNWMQAFQYLKQYLKSLDKNKRQVVFFDELPWLDDPKSDFFMAFEGFWNNFGCNQDNLMLIICGSATSWMFNKIINNHGGLYDRITYEIKLSPFTLQETEDFFKENNIKLPRIETTKAYMALGGIPYYLGYFKQGESVAENINNLFFSKNAKLKYEFDRLFLSIFARPLQTKTIVKLLSNNYNGYTRKEICEKLKITDNGLLSEIINSLIACDFVIKYYSAFGSKRETYYKLIDPFSIFYLKFVENKQSLNEDFFKVPFNSQSINSFYGHGFENICFNHTLQIKRALKIEGVACEFLPYRTNKENEVNTQIDMIIIRKDQVVNVCEMKFYANEFKVDEEYYYKVLTRQSYIETKLPKKAMVVNTLISSGHFENANYNSIFTKHISLDDLFDN